MTSFVPKFDETISTEELEPEDIVHFGFLADRLRRPTQNYSWNHDTQVSPLAVAGNLPFNNWPRLDWLKKVAEHLIVALDNGIRIEASAAKRPKRKRSWTA